MRYLVALALALLVVVSISSSHFSQTGQNETSIGVSGGGISVPGWTRKIDAKEAAAGLKLNSAKLAKEGNPLNVPPGPLSLTGTRKIKRKATTRSKQHST